MPEPPPITSPDPAQGFGTVPDAPSPTLWVTLILHPVPDQIGYYQTLDAQSPQRALVRSTEFLHPHKSRTRRPLEPNTTWVSSTEPITLACVSGGGLSVLASRKQHVECARVGEETATRVDAAAHFTRDETKRGVVIIIKRAIALLVRSCTLNPERIKRGRKLKSDFKVISPSMFEVLGLLRDQVGNRNAVFLHAETGTGKTMAEELIGKLKGRTRPAQRVSSATLMHNIAAAYLHGSSGPFDPADSVFEDAHNGLINFDEAHMLPAAAITTLQTIMSQFPWRGCRIKSGPDWASNAMLMFTTDQPQHVVDASLPLPFKQRIGGDQPVVFPPLRHRPEDIVFLALHFVVSQLSIRSGLALGPVIGAGRPGTGAHRPLLSPEFALGLLAFGWQGNVRQLRNMAKDACFSVTVKSDAWPDAAAATEEALLQLLARLKQPATVAILAATPAVGPPTPTPNPGAGFASRFKAASAVKQREMLIDYADECDWSPKAICQAFGWSTDSGANRTNMRRLGIRSPNALIQGDKRILLLDALDAIAKGALTKAEAAEQLGTSVRGLELANKMVNVSSSEG